jgi:SpoVK/Ycf46/Vps4 family AAA+-type ATPase
VETDRSGLVAGYVGQTATLTKKVFESALEGVLLVDEAYALARGDERDFGQEAIDTIVKLVEDHRDDIVVICAGYPDEMHKFVDSNPGLRSRFPKTIAFPDYSTDELVQIFEIQCKGGGYSPTPAALKTVRAWFDAQPRDKGFGNGRLARNLFEAAMACQASRIVSDKDPSNDELISLTPADIEAATSP